MDSDVKINDLVPEFIDINTARALGRINIFSLGDLTGMTREGFLSRSRRYGKSRRPGLAEKNRKPHFGKKAEEKTFDFMKQNNLEFLHSA
ncbi:MAG: hypothetical protein PHP25_01840 [Candidatus Moranbacteria bacterium]|nr:hypothetical protein [Candidatus Moranbacteria bacterium]